MIRYTETTTRGNSFKLKQGQVRYDVRKYMSANRVISAWNSLPEYVVNVEGTNVFKNRLDKYWSTLYTGSLL